METVKPLDVASGKGKLRRAFVKVINVKKLTGVVPEGDKVEKVKLDKDLVKNAANLSESFDKLEEEYEKRLAVEALLAKLFATVSSIKSGYAQLQYAQSPYDPAGIQKADTLVVSELKTLSEMKQSFLKNEFDTNPDRTLVLAEIQELRSLLKTYEIMGKKLECQLKLKDSEIIFLKEKFQESMSQNKLMEKRLNQSGQLCNPLDHNLHLSALSPSRFVAYLHHTVKSIRGFVKMMVEQMRFAGWDIATAAHSIQPEVFYYKQDHTCFAFEHFVCKIMFEAFHLPYFSTESSSKKSKEMFFERFTELRSLKAREYIASRPKSRFSRFCRAKYLQLVHPKMELALFGHSHVRNQVSAGEFPETSFCAAFLEMAKRVWLLHCLGFSFDPEASIFQASKGCRFSEVYMKSVSEEAFLSEEEEEGSLSETEPRVAFTVVPGFRIGKTSIQCEVYLSRSSQRSSDGEEIPA